MEASQNGPPLSPHLPRVDLHYHLEGAVRLETVLAISSQHKLPLPAGDVRGLEKAVFLDRPTPDILIIMPRFEILRQVFVDYDACQRVTWECLEDAAQQGLDYVEVRFSPLFMAEPHRLDPRSVTAAVCEAWQESCDRLPIQSRLIVILSRTYGPQACWTELECGLAYRSKGIAGLDLAGDEARHPAVQFRDHFRKAREAGLRLTAHAGEFAGAESVRQTVLELNPERLGHAVHAVDDPAVLDLLVERQIAIECCPTSNFFTGSIPDFASHPLPCFLERGLCATLNTDDPTLFGNLTLAEEYRRARDLIGLDAGQLAQVQNNSRKAAFLNLDTPTPDFR